MNVIVDFTSKEKNVNKIHKIFGNPVLKACTPNYSEGSRLMSAAVKPTNTSRSHGGAPAGEVGGAAERHW